MTPKVYSVYCLLENGRRVRYFGITRQCPHKRYLAHIAEARNSLNNGHKNRWIRKCESEGKSVSLKVIKKDITKARACKIEKMLISLFINSFSLVNYMAGGETGTPARDKVVATIACDGVAGSDVIELRGTSKTQSHYKLFVNGSLSRMRITKRGVLRLLARMVYGKMKR